MTMTTITDEALDHYRQALGENERIRKALEDLVNAKALSSVRSIVAGWLGEGELMGPFQHRHPANLGARIETSCGPMYELDEIMQKARAAIISCRSAQHD